MHIAKVNFDSDLRLAFTSAVREYLSKNKKDFNPRDHLSTAENEMTKHCIDII